MKTLKQLYTYKGGTNTNLVDKRDFGRLMEFIPVKDWSKFGFEPKEGIDTSIPILRLTKKNVLKKLKGDLAFAFEKALDKRGISSGLMFDVIKMWMWVLDDELVDFNDYAQYGLPFYKAVAIKYNLPNPIGKDEGNEEKYAS